MIKQVLVTAESLWTLESKVKRRMKKGQKLVPQSVQCADKQNSHGWWAAMEYDDSITEIKS